MCSNDVKVKLFNSFCTSFYGLTTWCNFTSEMLLKVSVAYKRIFRGLFMFKCDYTDIKHTSRKMLDFNISPFLVIERKLLYGFLKGLANLVILLLILYIIVCFTKTRRFLNVILILYITINILFKFLTITYLLTTMDICKIDFTLIWYK